ncbi:MAG: ATP-binding protein [Chloroflexota bacterium]
MDAENFRLLNALAATSSKEDYKKALDSLVSTLRKGVVFDNAVLYLTDEDKTILEVAYARAVGRGKSKEAEVSWGEEIANQVIAGAEIIIATPPSSKERTAMPYLLGFPLRLFKRDGALIFIRFGGPEFTSEQVSLAGIGAAYAALILEQHSLRDHHHQLDQARYRAQLQDDFIATVSHDLHTPLGFIKGYTTSLLRSDTVWDAATQREFLTVIDEETDHLINLIDHFLDSARLQSGVMTMDFQPVRLDSLIRDVVMRVNARYKSLVIDLTLEKAPPLQADTIRLTQVFENLFDNAIKYAPEESIQITLATQRNEQIITFVDTGPGIPPEHLPFIFERFYRVPGPSRRGTGLGLFICKQIVQAHNGQISVKTSPGHGTAFRIVLPEQQQTSAKRS